MQPEWIALITLNEGSHSIFKKENKMNLEDRHLKERPGTRTNTPLSLQSRHIPKPAAPEQATVPLWAPTQSPSPPLAGWLKGAPLALETPYLQVPQELGGVRLRLNGFVLTDAQEQGLQAGGGVHAEAPSCHRPQAPAPHGLQLRPRFFWFS